MSSDPKAPSLKYLRMFKFNDAIFVLHKQIGFIFKNLAEFLQKDFTTLNKENPTVRAW